MKMYLHAQELARQLRRDVIPILQPAGVKLFLVSIGPPERGLEFCKVTNFPPEQMLADPDNILYDAVGFYRGVGVTFFNYNTPLSILRRFLKNGAADLGEAMQLWKIWIPPKIEQSLQQGGSLVFQGSECVFANYEEATGAHVDLDALVRAALGTNQSP
ncbi:unnamed protein product [Ostreobium quekettii]|uniref:Uncharacterized protein n=1 Tax=Ostreobium quekettii TaxID=121088 RepID=A0A8S1JFU3_9CHLO|nr:unnamed protein product [Ostreobium quekettii]|eukprot:evm.model.scf_761.6 EVM.evm.TU.scf_761.6   scf_761:44574-45050(-)